MLRALLVDDEPAANFWLSDLLQRVEGIEVVGAVHSVLKAIEFLDDNPVDVVFLDFEMPNSRGSELISVVGQNTAVVMVTAHDTFAVQAFEFGVVDYILKPVQQDRLKMAVERVRSFCGNNRLELPELPRFVKGKVRSVVSMQDLLWIEARRNESILYHSRGENSHALKSLADWEMVLDPVQFQRVGRFYILNVYAVSAIQWKLSSTTQVYFFDSTAILKLKRHAAESLKYALLESGKISFASNFHTDEENSTWTQLDDSFDQQALETGEST